MQKYDVYVTVGAPTPGKVDAFLFAIQNLATHTDPTIMLANTYAIGHGRWGQERESSGFLFWTDLTSDQVEHVRSAAIHAGRARKQDAVGVAVIPAGSALIYLDGRES